MSGKSGRVSVFAIIVAGISLLISVGCLVILYTKENIFREVKGRLTDLEQEHDYILGEGGEVAGKLVGGAEQPRLCSLLPDPGPCGSQVTRYYYLPREDDCLEFPWGGCQGNDNNFLSVAQCRAACLVPLEKPRPAHLTPAAGAAAVAGPRLLLPPGPTRSFNTEDCFHPPDAGPCQDRISRFYYEDGKCKRFQYGGCAGNPNNFFTEGECVRNCASSEAEEAEDAGLERREREDSRRRPGAVRSGDRYSAEYICSLPEDTGTCTSTGTSEVRYRWEASLGECVKFYWSGCQGNNNNFVSEEKCIQRCARTGGAGQ